MVRAAAGGEPFVASVECISWNTTRRQFDCGVIDNMGPGGDPQFQIVDGGKCFACHKNRGPILGARPWSNSTHDDILRFALASSLLMNGSGLPHTGPFALPQVIGGSTLPDRMDGMALANPEAQDVDEAVRLGAVLRTNRNVFRLMTRSAAGRKALVALLVAITEPGVLEPHDKVTARAVDLAFDPSYYQFKLDWAELQKAVKPSALGDVDPTESVRGGFGPDRREYASGPRYDPAWVEEREEIVVPTTSCLRCHEIGATGRKALRFDPIPQLAFDPFDKAGRADWVRTADPKRKREVLKKLLERLVTDADMPPEDAPEHDLLRVKNAPAFEDVKQFLTTQLGQ